LSPSTIYVVVILALAALVVAVLLWRRRRRLRFIDAALPLAWLEIIQRNIPVYDRLDKGLRRQLQRSTRAFVYDKRFVGCAGLQITEEIKVTIAASASLLLLNRVTSGYATLRWIYVYPGAYTAEHTEYDAAGVASRKRSGRLGESWSNGKLVLSWDDAIKGVRNFRDGHNVILHEFAHQLDSEQGATNGAPVLASRQAYQSWAAVLSREFESLRRADAAGLRSLMDHYGATNPAEFFAVATETYFELPVDMARLHPELFSMLQAYYQVDPRAWLGD
jgi:Mlc titration factor MtfA (ptsG expression regulator)